MPFDNPRLNREFKTIKAMIECYCFDNHKNAGGLCPDCRALLDYAEIRLHKCPFGDNKPTCVKCPIHCYQPALREKIREVMRYAGPKMIWKHPILAIFHIIDGKRPIPPIPKRNKS